MQELKELYQTYKEKKLAFEAAKKDEEKYKKLLKDAMEAAQEKTFTDSDGYVFERIASERKSIDEERLLAELHARGLEDCIGVKEIVNESATLDAVEDGRLPQEVVNDCLRVTPIVTLKLTAPKGKKR